MPQILRIAQLDQGIGKYISTYHLSSTPSSLLDLSNQLYYIKLDDKVPLVHELTVQGVRTFTPLGAELLIHATSDKPLILLLEHSQVNTFSYWSLPFTTTASTLLYWPLDHAHEAPSPYGIGDATERPVHNTAAATVRRRTSALHRKFPSTWEVRSASALIGLGDQVSLHLDLIPHTPTTPLFTVKVHGWHAFNTKWITFNTSSAHPIPGQSAACTFVLLRVKRAHVRFPANIAAYLEEVDEVAGLGMETRGESDHML